MSIIKNNESINLSRLKKDLNETPEERQARLDEWARRSRLKAQKETPEQRQQRLEKYKKRYQEKIANETPEQRAERLLYHRKISKAMRMRRAKGETPEEKEERRKRVLEEKREKFRQKIISEAKEKIEKVEKTLEILKEKTKNDEKNSSEVFELDPLGEVPKPSEIHHKTCSKKFIKFRVLKKRQKSQNPIDAQTSIKQEPEIAIEDLPKNSFASNFNKCSFCAEIFEFKSELILHEMKCPKKSSNKPQNSSQKSSQINRPAEIQRQSNSTSKSTKENILKKFFKCRRCNFMTESKFHIKNHSRDHKKDKNQQLKVDQNLKKYFKCKHCKFLTESKEEIVSHAREHKESVGIGIKNES